MEIFREKKCFPFLKILKKYIFKRIYLSFYENQIFKVANLYEEKSVCFLHSKKNTNIYFWRNFFSENICYLRGKNCAVDSCCLIL